MRGDVIEIHSHEEVLLLGQFAGLHIPRELHNPMRAQMILRCLAAMPAEMHQIRNYLSERSSGHLTARLSDHDIIKMVNATIESGQLQTIVLARIQSNQAHKPAHGVGRRPTSSVAQAALPRRTPLAVTGNGPPVIASTAPSDFPSSSPPRPKPVVQWSLEERIAEVIRRAAPKVPGEVAETLLSLLTPESLAIVAGTIGIAAAANLTPYGWAADAIIAGIAFGFGGLMAIHALGDLVECFKKTASAKSDQDLDAAADALARAVVALGVVGLMAVLHRIGARKGGAGAGGANTGEATKVARPVRSVADEPPPVKAETTKTPAPKDAKKTYSRPSGFRKGVREDVWEQAKGPDGKVRDPLTNQEMNPDDPWDMGHKPGYEFRKHQESAGDRGIDRKQFLDEHNNPEHYRPELPSSNRSHAGEDKTGDYFGE